MGRFDKGTREWEFFGELFGIVEKYYDPRSGADYWSALTHDLTDLAHRCEDNKQLHALAKNLAHGFLDYVEEVAHGASTNSTNR